MAPPQVSSLPPYDTAPKPQNPDIQWIELIINFAKETYRKMEALKNNLPAIGIGLAAIAVAGYIAFGGG